MNDAAPRSVRVDRRVTPPAAVEHAIERAVLQAVAPIHARTFGIAVGTAMAVALAAITLVALVQDPTDQRGLGLIGIYFRGYAVSVPGLVIGALWAFVVGFVVGACLAACRNVVLRTWLRWVQARANLAATQDILDQI